MYKYYEVHLTYPNGNREHKEFTNKREAKSYCWKWINQQKEIFRDRTATRDYGELQAKIDVYYDGQSFDYESPVIALYY